MRVNALRLIAALTVLAIPLSAGAVPPGRIAKPPTLGKPRRRLTVARPVIIGNPTPMPCMANLGQLIARPAGDPLVNSRACGRVAQLC